MSDEITVMFDRLSRAALDVLTADGTSPAEAITRAVLREADRTPDPDDSCATSDSPGESYQQWLARQAAQAPPLTEYQEYVLTTSIIEQQQSWLGETEWRLSTLEDM